MRTALLLAVASIATAPVIAQTGTMPPTDPPIPETPAPPPAPMPPAEPAPEIPQPTPAPVPSVPMATPPSAQADVAESGATTEANLQPVVSTKKYPVCTKTVTDNCINRGGK